MDATAAVTDRASTIRVLVIEDEGAIATAVADRPTKLRVADIRIARAARRVWRAQSEVRLTATAFDLLRHERRGR